MLHRFPSRALMRGWTTTSMLFVLTPELMRPIKVPNRNSGILWCASVQAWAFVFSVSTKEQIVVPTVFIWTLGLETTA